MGANRYSCGISLGAPRAALVAKNSHNMAIFLHFLALLAIVLGVVTTVINASGIERTQTLLTHVGRWYGVIFALSRYLSGPGVVQKWLFWWSKSGFYGELIPGWGSDLESVL